MKSWHTRCTVEPGALTLLGFNMQTNGRILIVDDERAVREMLRNLLTEAGYEVIFAEDGMEAIASVNANKPDLVISDGLLPKLHGFLLCKAIKELPNPPKVILITGVYTKPSYKSEVTREYGADDILKKPFDNVELLACVRKHLPDSRAANRMRTGNSSAPNPLV